MQLSNKGYLTEVKNTKYRSATTKIRISAHKFPVETGRYQNIPYNDRLCEYCDLNEGGNEEHYTMHCKNKKLVQLGEKFMNEIYRINKSFYRFNKHDLFMYIMAMKDTSIINIVARFFYRITMVYSTRSVSLNI